LDSYAKQRGIRVMWADIKYYLGRVSRSFSLAIPLLDQGLREIIGLGYIILRMLDSIEDASLEPKIRKELYTNFLLFLSKVDVPVEVCELFSKQKWEGITEEEKELFTTDNLVKIIKYFWSIDKYYQDIIRSCVQEMMLGMKKFTWDNEKIFVSSSPMKKSLRSQGLYDEYCYYVAGTVGIMLTKICIYYYRSNLKFTKSLLNKSLGFSRVLQKVNIIKDWKKDIQKGYCFLPAVFFKKIKNLEEIKINLSAAIKDITKDFSLAKKYLESLPREFVGFEKFCLMALLPAYETIFYLNDIDNKDDRSRKISREKMLECFIIAQDLKKGRVLLGKLDSKLRSFCLTI
jgi:farnesyl-diphosphate farnesyltransferase